MADKYLVTVETDRGPITREVPAENIPKLKSKYGDNVKVGDKVSSFEDYTQGLPPHLLPQPLPESQPEGKAGPWESGAYGALSTLGDVGLRGAKAISPGLDADDEIQKSLESWSSEKAAESDPRYFQMGQVGAGLGMGVGGAVRTGASGFKAARDSRTRQQALGAADDLKYEAARAKIAHQRKKAIDRSKGRQGEFDKRASAERAAIETEAARAVKVGKRLGKDAKILQKRLDELNAKAERKPAPEKISLGREPAKKPKPAGLTKEEFAEKAKIEKRLQKLTDKKWENRDTQRVRNERLRSKAEEAERKSADWKGLQTKAETRKLRDPSKREVSAAREELMAAFEGEGFPVHGKGVVGNTLRDTAGYGAGKITTGSHLGGVSGKMFLRSLMKSGDHGRLRKVMTPQEIDKLKLKAASGAGSEQAVEAAVRALLEEEQK